MEMGSFKIVLRGPRVTPGNSQSIHLDISMPRPQVAVMLPGPYSAQFQATRNTQGPQDYIQQCLGRGCYVVLMGT